MKIALLPLPSKPTSQKKFEEAAATNTIGGPASSGEYEVGPNVDQGSAYIRMCMNNSYTFRYSVVSF